MKVIFASGNQNKIREVETILADFASKEQILGKIEVLSLADVGFSGDIEETGTTFEENALIKARAVSGFGYPVIADDSGLSVDALGGAPGVYSARFSGEHGNDEKNNDLLLEKLRGLPEEQRGARYVCVMACVFPDGREMVCRGEICGRILTERQGKSGFGYDPLFYVPELGCTFAEATLQQKNEISHRGRALTALCREMLPFLKDESSAL